MLEVPASEFAKRFAQYRRQAQRGPVAVTHHGEVTEVLISKAEYEELQRFRARRGARVPLTDDELLTALEAVDTGRGNEHLNEEMESDRTR